MVTQKDEPTFVFQMLEYMRGSLGVESAIDVILRLLFVRRIDPAAWRDAVVRVQESGNPMPILDRAIATRVVHDRGRLLEQPGSESPALVGHLLMELDHIDVTQVPRLFEECLVARQSFVGRTGQEMASPAWLARLEGAATGTGAGAVHDPACGFGGGLLEAAKTGATELSGADVNQGAVAIAEMRLAVHGYRAELRCEDSLLRGVPRPVDRILCDPPFGAKLTPEQLSRWESMVRHSDDTGAWLALAFDGLREGGGRAAVLTIPERLARSKTFMHQVERGWVEAVIQLPPGSVPGSKLSGSLVVLSRAFDNRPQVLVLNPSSFFQASARSGVALTQEGINLIEQALVSWRLGGELALPPHLGVVLTRREIASSGFRPRFTPPPEEATRWPEPAAHLLQCIYIENVKSLAGAHTIPLAPLTLVYGPNSVGKSSLLQGLLLLMQSFRAGQFVANGALARLGSYAGLVSGHEMALGIRVGIEFGIVLPWPLPHGSLHPSLVRQVVVQFASDGGSGGQVAGASIATSGQSPLQAHRVEDGEPWLVALDSMDDWVTLLDDPNRAFIHPRRQASETSGKYKRLGAGLRKLRQLPDAVITGQGEGLLPRSISVPDVGYETVDPAQMIQQRLSRVLDGVNIELERLANDLIYLGPTRPAPQRFTERQSYIGSSASSDYVSYLYDNTSALLEINDWLKRLSIPYAMEVHPVMAGGAATAVGDLVAVVLTDLRSGVKVSPADVGYGVSQVLPIVAQCLRFSDRVICIEQPELHLHPRLQGNLAELLVEATKASGAGNQIIAETHSEHILLRIQRLIRQEQLLPQDVSVLYVDQDERGAASVQRVRLGDQGEFLDPWPTGFFDDSLEDVMGGWE